MKLNRNFTILLTGQSFANIGDVLYMVSIIYMIYELTGSAASAAFVPFIITSSMFVSNALTPLLMQRFNLKWLLAGSQIGKTALLFGLAYGMPLFSLSNYYFGFFIIGLIALLDGCAGPATQSLIPIYVEKTRLLRANGVNDAITQSIQTVMWFIGGSLLFWLAANDILWLAAGLFLISSLLLCCLSPVAYKPDSVRTNWQQISHGWKLVAKSPFLKRIAWMDFLETAAGTVWIAAILLVFVQEALYKGEAWWGFINGSFFLGLIAGSLLCLSFSRVFEEKLSWFIFVGAFISSIATFLFGLSGFPVLALLLSFLVGVAGQIKNIPQQTLIQSSTAESDLPTVFTTLGAIATGTFGIASLLMGIIADVFGIRSVFMLSGFLLLVVGLIAYKGRVLLWRPQQL